MNTITIDKKKYVFVPEKQITALQQKAATALKTEKNLPIADARKLIKKLIKSLCNIS